MSEKRHKFAASKWKRKKKIINEASLSQKKRDNDNIEKGMRKGASTERLTRNTL